MKNSSHGKLKMKEVDSIKALDARYRQTLTAVTEKKSSSEVLKYVVACLKSEGVSLDLSKLKLYYDGLAEEMQTSCGTMVFHRPVWYGGIDTDPESFTLCVYQLEAGRLCITLSRFFQHEHYVEKDLFVKIPA